MLICEILDTINELKKELDSVADSINTLMGGGDNVKAQIVFARNYEKRVSVKLLLDEYDRQKNILDNLMTTQINASGNATHAISFTMLEKIHKEIVRKDNI